MPTISFKQDEVFEVMRAVRNELRLTGTNEILVSALRKLQLTAYDNPFIVAPKRVAPPSIPAHKEGGVEVRTFRG